jgi:hypothetical protein
LLALHFAGLWSLGGLGSRWLGLWGLHQSLKRILVEIVRSRHLVDKGHIAHLGLLVVRVLDYLGHLRVELLLWLLLLDIDLLHLVLVYILFIDLLDSILLLVGLGCLLLHLEDLLDLFLGELLVNHFLL